MARWLWSECLRRLHFCVSPGHGHLKACLGLGSHFHGGSGVARELMLATAEGLAFSRVGLLTGLCERPHSAAVGSPWGEGPGEVQEEPR